MRAPVRLDVCICKSIRSKFTLQTTGKPELTSGYVSFKMLLSTEVLSTVCAEHSHVEYGAIFASETQHGGLIRPDGEDKIRVTDGGTGTSKEVKATALDRVSIKARGAYSWCGSRNCQVENGGGLSSENSRCLLGPPQQGSSWTSSSSLINTA
jgi:hypothetical protein